MTPALIADRHNWRCNVAKKSFSIFIFAVLMFSLTAHAADFTFSDINGKRVKLADYRGQWVIANIWATWCPPCLEEIPELISFHNAHKDKDAVVLGLNYEEIALPKLKKFVGDLRINYPVLITTPEIEIELAPITGFPSTFLISPQGQVVLLIQGAVTKEKLEGYIKNPPVTRKR